MYSIKVVVLLALCVSITYGCGRRRRRSPPRPPVNNPPSIGCPRVSDVTASSGMTSAQVSWSSPSVSDDHGGWSLRQIGGQSSGSRFSEGHHSVTYKVTDRGGKSAVCSFSFRVIVTRCGYLSRPSNGAMSCTLSDNIYGRRCGFSCNSGYWLDGSSSSVCQSNGRFSHSSPRCLKKKCSTLSLPTHSVGSTCTDSRYYGSMCSLRCNTAKGYTPRKLNFAKCLANTKWQYQNWNCEDTERPKILNCPEGELKTSDIHYRWPEITASDNSGSVTLTQIQGVAPGSTMIEGLQIIQYKAVDPSGNEAPICTFSVTFTAPSCPPPVPGKDDYDPQFTCKDHKVGSYCKATCPLTHLIGAKFIKCERTGGVIPTSNWIGYDDPYPKCYKKTCSDLRPPTNGVLVCDKFLGGETCQVHCNANYDLPESMQHLTYLICSGGRWAPVREAPSCTELAFPDSYNLPSELYYYGGNCSDSKTNEAIRDNFLSNLVNAAVVTCEMETCVIENVEVTCGPVSDEEGDYYYDDEYDDLNGDYDYVGGEDYADYAEDTDLLKRRRRAIQAPTGPSQTTQSTSTQVPRTERYIYTTAPLQTTPAGEGSGLTEGSGGTDNPYTTSPLPTTHSEEGSGSTGERRRKKKKPQSRTTIKFNFAVKNVSRIITDDMVLDIFSQITNSTSITLNGTRSIQIRTGAKGNVTFTCGPGKVLSNGSAEYCVACPAGSFHNQELDRCDLCPVHSFSNKSGQTKCTPCDQHMGTETNGTTSMEDCKRMCSPGFYSESGLAPCSPCQLGSIQPDYFRTECNPCPSDSSTVELGGSSLEQCVPFDVLARGPVKLSIGPVIHDWVEELTLSFWIRTLPPAKGNVNISFVLSHPTRGHQLTLYLADQTDIKMRDANVPVHASLRHDLWTHMALVWKGYPSFVDIYRGGKRVEHYGGHTPLCFLPQGTELTINIGESSGATLREVYVIPHSNTSQLIANMASRCSPGDIGYSSLISRIKSSNRSLISMVVPSVCSEINRCSPDPCPGHYCRSFKHDFECVCKGGYTGKTCSVAPDYCVVANKCQNNATCHNEETGINCTCNDDYKGRYCETPIIHGNWSPWSAWTECSLTCGGGERSRSRICNNPAPEPDVGKPCHGVPNQMAVCNEERCPECRTSQLQLGRGISAECVKKSDGSMNCSVTCDDGLVFPEEKASYTCRDEVWVPTDKTISCVEFSVPGTVGFSFTVPYKTRVDNRDQDVKAIEDKVSMCASNTSCVMDETCTFKVVMETCIRGESKCNEFPEGYKATLKFTAPVVASNWSVLISKRNLKSAWESLNETFSDLEDMYEDCFVVLLSSGSVKPGTVVADEDLTCEKGTVPDQGYCAACAPGTRYYNDSCVECERGWFQEETQQSICDKCHGAANTRYLGSTLRSECLAPPEDSYLLMTDPITDHVWTVNMSDFTLTPANLPDKVSVSASGFDPVSQHIFYADRVKPAIHSVGPDASQTYVTLNWAASVDHIAIDHVSRLIFYADKGNDVIGVVTMETKYSKTVIQEGTYMPRHIALDPHKGVLYWIDWAADQKIERAFYDGTERKTLVGSTTLWPEGLALDLKSDKLYWSDGGKKTVEVMDVDGSNRMTILTSEINFPSSIALFNDFIFYSGITQNNSIIMRVNMDGTGLATTELPPFRYISDIHVYQMGDLQSESNGCTEDNGGCTFICLPRPSGSRVCACPDGYELNENMVDCTKQAASKKRWWDVWMRPRQRRHAALLTSRLH